MCVCVCVYTCTRRSIYIPSVSCNERPYGHRHTEPVVLIIVAHCMTKHVQNEVLKIEITR